MEHSEADASFDEFAEWRRLDAQARGIADRLLAQGSATAQRMGAQVERYAAIKASLAGQAYLEDSKDDDGDRSHWERAEWRRLTQQLLIQARHIDTRSIHQPVTGLFKEPFLVYNTSRALHDPWGVLPEPHRDVTDVHALRDSRWSRH